MSVNLGGNRYVYAVFNIGGGVDCICGIAGYYRVAVIVDDIAEAVIGYLNSLAVGAVDAECDIAEIGAEVGRSEIDKVLKLGTGID